MFDQQDASLLRCVACGSTAISSGSETEFRCAHCRHRYPVVDGILQAEEKLLNDNQVVAEFYNSSRWRRFQRFESLFFLLHGGEKRARRQITQHLPELAGTKLLIGAIGEGNDIEVIPPGASICGIDISIGQLRECARRYAQADVKLVLGECERTPFVDQYFDNVLCMGGFNFFADKAGCLREMVRVTRTGGRIVVSDEIPKLSQRGQKRPIGRRIMNRFLGGDFAEVIRKQAGGLVIEDVARNVLSDCQVHPIWRGSGYCLVATVTDADRAAAAAVGQRAASA